MISCMIDAMEGLELATVEISGVFLKNDYDKGDININMEEDVVTLLEEIYPAY